MNYNYQVSRCEMMLFFIIVSVLFLSVASHDPVVKITNGEIRGQILKSRNGREYSSFTGIPYAKPPIEGLRFKSPEPVDSWDGVLDGRKYSPKCIQINHFIASLRNIIEGDEDCLYLNVYTSNVNGKLPVMVWIHGGGFLAGEGGSKFYGPDYFMDKDVVLVSFNYRLGLFGFGSTEDNVMPGNYGMKDQVAALRWVRDNVAMFGGDPEQVTIFGESAGGASTGYHLLSPMSKGLFHKAILQSGAPTCYWATSVPGLPRKRIEAVATIAGCHADTSEEILHCLSRLPATFLVKLSNKFFEWDNHPAIPFPPVVEPCDSNLQEAFLCHHPIIDFKQESIVPVIIGINSGEGGIFVASLYNDTSLKNQELHKNFNRMVASLLEYKHLSLPEHLDKIGNEIIKMYFPSGKVDDHTHSNAVDMISDGVITSGVIDMALKLSSPIYFYLYDYENEFSFNQLYGECNKSLGVSHADELISLFKLNNLFSQSLKKKDLEVSKVMIDIWTKFASPESPTTDGTDNGLIWPQFTSIKSSILHIDSVQPKIITSPFEEKYTFWKSLPIFSRLQKLTLSKMLNIKNEL